MAGESTLVRLPGSRGGFIYVNPAHVVQVKEAGRDEAHLFMSIGGLHEYVQMTPKDVRRAFRGDAPDDGRVCITVSYGSERHTEAVHIENVREWAANLLAENGEIELPDDGDPDPSQVDDATVVEVLGASIGSNLDYDKLR